MTLHHSGSAADRLSSPLDVIVPLPPLYAGIHSRYDSASLGMGRADRPSGG